MPAPFCFHASPLSDPVHQGRIEAARTCGRDGLCGMSDRNDCEGGKACIVGDSQDLCGSAHAPPWGRCPARQHPGRALPPRRGCSRLQHPYPALPYQGRGGLLPSSRERMQAQHERKASHTGRQKRAPRAGPCLRQPRIPRALGSWQKALPWQPAEAAPPAPP